MRKILYFCIVTLFLIPAGFGQVGTPAEEAMPSVSDMLETLTGEGGGTSTTDAIMQSAQQSMMQRMQPQEITEETVRSAVEGTLVTEETAVPEVNQEIAEAIDSRTQRYLPRIQLDFGEFPLRRISGRFTGTLPETDGVEELTQSNKSLSNGIVKRIQTRLKIDTVRFEFRDRTTGSVATERQRDMIGVMVRMEPGIDQVKNEIVVKK